jgi:hypothetical protein
MTHDLEQMKVRLSLLRAAVNELALVEKLAVLGAYTSELLREFPESERVRRCNGYCEVLWAQTCIDEDPNPPPQESSR